MALPKPFVSITQKVLDFMIVDVVFTDATTAFHYTIVDSNNQVIRKGNFKGQMIQLRLSHIPEGKYQFMLYQNEALVADLAFEKQSAAFNGYIF